MLPLDQYDHILIAFSGGKDSLACLLHLIELSITHNIDLDRIELWHHAIDGQEGSDLMDWPCTPGYCKAVAQAFGLAYFVSWKVGGFEGEMMRDNARTASTKFETPQGIMQGGGERGKPGTRLMFPQVTGDLSKRWCSAYLKIDVMALAIRNDPRFKGKKVLVVTGERAQESAKRACYASEEKHRTDNRNGRTGRLVDHWRPVHSWDEAKVWGKIGEWGINPHPAYRLGFGRVSCMFCIFASCNQLATLYKIARIGFMKILKLEHTFGVTIQQGSDIYERAMQGTPYADMSPDDIRAALSTEFNEAIFLGDAWALPSGAFGESTGAP